MMSDTMQIIRAGLYEPPGGRLPGLGPHCSRTTTPSTIAFVPAAPPLAAVEPRWVAVLAPGAGSRGESQCGAEGYAAWVGLMARVEAAVSRKKTTPRASTVSPWEWLAMHRRHCRGAQKGS